MALKHLKKVSTPSMEKDKFELFVNRTNRHIELVTKNLEKFQGFRELTFNELKMRGITHDKSKFSPSEQEAYTCLNWSYYCKCNNIPFELTPVFDEVISSGLKLHARINRHHPEAHSDVNQMSLLDLVEMIADWTAIAQENGRTSCLPWALENLDKKWSFSPEKKSLIFEIIAEMDRRNHEK